VRDVAAYLNTAAVGTSGAPGSGDSRSSNSNQLAAVDRPYNWAVFAQTSQASLSNRWHFAEGTEVTTPASADAGFIGWRVAAAAVTLAGRQPATNVFLAGDALRYRPGLSVRPDPSTYGDVALGEEILRVGADAGSPLTVTDDFYQRELARFETVAGMRTFLEGVATNGYPRWQSYVLGLNYDDSNAVVRADLALSNGVVRTETAVRVTPLGIAPRAGTGFSVWYELLRAASLVPAPPVWSRVAGPQTDAVMKTSCSDASSFYRIGISFTPTQEVR